MDRVRDDILVEADTGGREDQPPFQRSMKIFQKFPKNINWAEAKEPVSARYDF